MVRKPMRIGPACAGAAGILSACVATPAASAPLRTVRRLTVIAFLPSGLFFCLFCLFVSLRRHSGARAKRGSPESIITAWGYRFRARAFGAPRNDSLFLRLQILPARPGLAVVDRVLQELVGIVGPELAHVRIRLDHGVDELATFLLDLADIDVADHVAVFVEAHGAARGLDLVARAQRRLQRILVLDLGIDLLERRFEHGAVGIGGGRIEARVDLVVAVHVLDELLVGRAVDLRGIPARGDDADRLIAHLLQQRFVDRRHAAQDRDAAAVFLVLLEELEAVRAGEADEDHIDVLLDLRDVGAVVG